MKILQLSPQFPLPADNGGKIGIFNITRQYALQGADVTFFTYSDEYIPVKLKEDFGRFAELIIVPHSVTNTKSRILKNFICNRSIYLSKHINIKIIDAIDKLLAKNKFDFVHADHSAMMPLALYIKDKYNIPCALRLHNIEWMIWRRYFDSLSRFSPLRLFIGQQTKLLRSAEIDFYQKADVCFAITEHDREIALEMAPNANVIVAGAGVDLEQWTPAVQQRQDHRMIYASVYAWRPNEEAIRWFIDKVFPSVRSIIPDAELDLLGKQMPDWLVNLKTPGINPIGYVDSVVPYFNKASLYISPLFAGSGIRIKILEAMAMQLPVVASTIAAEGISAGEKEGLFRCDSAQEFSDCIINLLRYPDQGIEAGVQARKYIEQNFTWQSSVGLMIKAINQQLHKELANE